MSPTVSVFSDYVCPFCFLAEVPLAQVAGKMNVTIEWKPFELRPEPVPTLCPEDEYLPRVWRQSVYPLAAELGVPIHLPSISPQPYSRLAFEGFQHARAHGRASDYNHAVFVAFFQEDRNIGDPDVLSAVAESVGLDPVAFRADLNAGTFRLAHQQALSEAQRLGIHSVPTIIVGHHRIAGLARVETLERLVATAMDEVDLRSNDRRGG